MLVVTAHIVCGLQLCGVSSAEFASKKKFDNSDRIRGLSAVSGRSCWRRGLHRGRCPHMNSLTDENRKRDVAFLSSYRNTPGNSAMSVLEVLEQLQPLETSRLECIALEDVRDAMHRTIAGMLGLLPNEQFSVTIDMQRDSLAQLVISSMVTGYALHNAQDRLGLQRSLEIPTDSQTVPHSRDEEVVDEIESRENQIVIEDDNVKEFVGELEARIEALESMISSMRMRESQGAGLDASMIKKNIENAVDAVDRTNEDLEPGESQDEDRNILLDYIRNLDVDSVSSLSIMSEEVESSLQYLTSGLVGRLPTDLPEEEVTMDEREDDIKSKPWSLYGFGADGNIINPLTDASFSGSQRQESFQVMLRASRDYIYRLLYWSMLVGYYSRRIEYQLQLKRSFDDLIPQAKVDPNGEEESGPSDSKSQDPNRDGFFGKFFGPREGGN